MMGEEYDYIRVNASDIMRKLDRLAEDMAGMRSDTHTTTRVLEAQVAGLTDVTNRQTKVESRVERIERDYTQKRDDCKSRYDSVRAELIKHVADSKKDGTENRTYAISFGALVVAALALVGQLLGWGAGK